MNSICATIFEFILYYICIYYLTETSFAMGKGLKATSLHFFCQNISYKTSDSVKEVILKFHIMGWDAQKALVKSRSWLLFVDFLYMQSTSSMYGPGKEWAVVGVNIRSSMLGYDNVGDTQTCSSHWPLNAGQRHHCTSTPSFFATWYPIRGGVIDRERNRRWLLYVINMVLPLQSSIPPHPTKVNHIQLLMHQLCHLSCHPLRAVLVLGSHLTLCMPSKIFPD